MGLSFPREAFLEMFFPGSGWVDVTSQVRKADPMSVTRGRANEQGQVAPSTFSAVMRNETGNFSPGNPMGAYYGSLSRNTPVQFGFGLVRDTFSRTVVDGLGSTDTGETWTLDGTAANFDVGSGVATIAISAASTARHAYLASLSSWADYEVTADITVPYPNGTNNSAGLIFRGSTTSDAWRLSLTVASGGGVSMNIADGAGTLMGSIYTVDTVSAGTYRVRALVENGTVFGKAWPVAGAQPYAWQVSHTATTGLNTAGWVGIRARTGSGASNVTFTFDNFTVRVLRFAGELAELKPQWNENHKAKWATLEAAGIMRRLGQGKKPLKAALRRFIEANATQPLAYWPFDDGSQVRAGRISVGVGTDATIRDSSAPGAAPDPDPQRVFAAGRLAPWLKPSAACRSHITIQGNTGLSSTSTGWTAHLAIAFDGAYSSNLMFDMFLIAMQSYSFDSSGGQWSVEFNSADQIVTIVCPDNLTTADISNPGDLYDAGPHLFSLRVTQSGANATWTLYVDGVSIGTGSQASITVTNPRGALLANSYGEDKLRSINALTIYAGTGPSMDDLVDAMRGHRGEAAGRRMERLCQEEGLAFTYVGDLDDTAPMGPQGVETLLDLLQECADADLGSLHETRSTIGFSFRALNSLCAQEPSVTLDYTAKQVSPPLLPSSDDQNTRNKVTAKRVDGGEYTDEQTAGPLNTNNPGDDPDGVGVYDHQVTVNVETDEQLPGIAAWRRHIGTVDEDRYPKIKVEMAALAIDGNATLEAALLTLDADDRLTVENLQAADVFQEIDQIARGYTETFSPETRQHSLTFTSAPYRPYRTVVWDDPGFQWDSGATELTADISSSATSMQGTSTDGITLWTTQAGDFPQDVEIGIGDRPGEVVTVSAVSGASSPQTFTISARGVNGVQRAWSAGATIRTPRRFYWRLP